MKSLFDKNKHIQRYADQYVELNKRMCSCDDIIFAGLKHALMMMEWDKRHHHRWYVSLMENNTLLDGIGGGVYFDWCLDNTGHTWWFGNLSYTDCDVTEELEHMYVCVKKDERDPFNSHIRVIQAPFMVSIRSLVDNYTEDGFDYTKPFRVPDSHDVNMGLCNNAGYQYYELVPGYTHIDAVQGVKIQSSISYAMMDLLHRFVETLDSKGFVHVKR